MSRDENVTMKNNPLKKVFDHVVKKKECDDLEHELENVLMSLAQMYVKMLEEENEDINSFEEVLEDIRYFQTCTYYYVTSVRVFQHLQRRHGDKHNPPFIFSELMIDRGIKNPSDELFMYLIKKGLIETVEVNNNGVSKEFTDFVEHNGYRIETNKYDILIINRGNEVLVTSQYEHHPIDFLST